MVARLDLTNQKFGLLVAKYPTERRSVNGIFWCCRCYCGQYVERLASQLSAGRVGSCGCTRRPSRLFHHGWVPSNRTKATGPVTLEMEFNIPETEEIVLYDTTIDLTGFGYNDQDLQNIFHPCGRMPTHYSS